MKWYVYILKCRDESLYTGITTDIQNRVDTHNRRKGAKAIKGKLPAILVHNEMFENRSSASKRESEIKSWKREQKLSLINNI